MTHYNRITIEPYHTSLFNGFAVYGHGTYPRHSVLAGQASRTHLDMGDTLEALKAAWPQAEVLDHSTKPFRMGNESLAELSGLPSTPPSWFDPRDAGERWDDDY
jgi:hypothetical protein